MFERGTGRGRVHVKVPLGVRIGKWVAFFSSALSCFCVTSVFPATSDFCVLSAASAFYRGGLRVRARVRCSVVTGGHIRECCTLGLGLDWHFAIWVSSVGFWLGLGLEEVG